MIICIFSKLLQSSRDDDGDENYVLECVVEAQKVDLQLDSLIARVAFGCFLSKATALRN